MFQVKRIYEEASPEDGIRILVDRVWPRGVSRSAAMLDQWMKDIAPSTQLRKWFNHDPGRWREFKRRYFRELTDERSGLVGELKRIGEKKTVTLLYSARNTEHNQAQALRDYLLAGETAPPA